MLYDVGVIKVKQTGTNDLHAEAARIRDQILETSRVVSFISVYFT